ncbi:MAG: hypothetical protein JWQ03_38 [Variovorax sp.]|nr:hypothetical protein [Variovorax sp.]
MTGIQARRKLIVIILLCVAVGGALLRRFAEPASTMRDIGTLLMLLWVPIIGNIISWLVQRLRRSVAPEPSAFETRGVFTAHALVELTLRAPQLPSEDIPIPEGEHFCALVLGHEGFSARWLVPSGQSLRRGQPHTLQVEFLAPTVALPRFPRETIFRMLVGESFIGDGRVLQVADSA